MAPGLFREGDGRGPAWEALLEREIGSLAANPDGLNAVDAKELNRRLFAVAQRLADDVLSLHLQPLLDPAARPGLKRRLQSAFAVGMVNFLEMPYYIGWAFNSRDRNVQDQLRAYFLGERRRSLREKVAVFSATPLDGRGPAGTASGLAAVAQHVGIDVRLLTCSTEGRGERPDGVDFRALAWRPPLDGSGPRYLVPPVVEILDYIEENGFSALHTDSPGVQGFLAAVAARFLHLPLTAAVDPRDSRPELPAGAVVSRLRARYLRWFYGQLEEAYVPTDEAARDLVAGGLAPDRVVVLPELASPGPAV